MKISLYRYIIYSNLNFFRNGPRTLPRHVALYAMRSLPCHFVDIIVDLAVLSAAPLALLRNFF